MPELRKDPISGRWVIISTERSKRPSDFKVEADDQLDAFAAMCPYDEGRESQSPEEILAYRDGGGPTNSPGWQVRVVTHVLPLMKRQGEMNRHGVGMFDTMNAIGAHETIIETPHHGEQIPDMDDSQVRRIFHAYRDRLNTLFQDSRIKYVLIFKNHKINPEISHYHSISHLIAMPMLPKHVKEEMSGSKQFYDFKERCLLCDIVRQEIADGVRVVDENRSFLAFCPFASRSPFEINILPKEHQSTYTDITDDEIKDLAALLKRYLAKLRAALHDPPYNMMLHTRPAFLGHRQQASTLERDFHWHIEVVPNLTKLAGFEWGTGFFINPTSPEEAAEFLRNFKDF